MALLGWLLVALGGLVIVGQWALVVMLVIRARRGDAGGSSFVPLFGGGLACAGCALVPALGWKLGLVAIALDPGCFVLAPLWCLVAAARRHLYRVQHERRYRAIVVRRARRSSRIDRRRARGP